MHGRLLRVRTAVLPSPPLSRPSLCRGCALPLSDQHATALASLSDRGIIIGGREREGGALVGGGGGGKRLPLCCGGVVSVTWCGEEGWLWLMAGCWRGNGGGVCVSKGDLLAL